MSDYYMFSLFLIWFVIPITFNSFHQPLLKAATHLVSILSHYPSPFPALTMSRLSSTSDSTAVATDDAPLSIHTGDDTVLHPAPDKLEKPDVDHFQVGFEPGDPSNPKVAAPAM
jgi:hypothetical protein